VGESLAMPREGPDRLTLAGENEEATLIENGQRAETKSGAVRI
jgi:hypothetical protein